MHEIAEISGFHKLTPDTIDKILPQIWMSQYSVIEITEVPVWIQATVPDSAPVTPPDGIAHEIKMMVGLRENAPMNTKETIKMLITTGRFMRTFFPSWFPLCDEYTIERSVLIQTGEWEVIDDTSDDNWLQEEKIVTSSREEGIDVCFILFIILSITVIFISVYFISRRYP